MSSAVRWPALWLALLVALVFANSLHGEYHLDSIYRVQQNAELDVLWPLHRHFLDPTTSATLPTLVAYRPMLPLSLSIDAAVARSFGMDRLLAFHLGNVVLHILATWLLYRMLVELLTHWGSGSEEDSESRRLAFWACALYAVPPIAGVPVNYLCGRDVTLMSAFLCAAFTQYLRWRREGGGMRGQNASTQRGSGSIYNIGAAPALC